MGVVGNVIGGVVLVLLLIIVIGVIFSKDEDANDPAVKMAKWEEHLEKRRAAFAEGLSEEGVEARGLKNYTWEEWQARQQNTKKAVKSLTALWYEHQEMRGELLHQGIDQRLVEEMGYESLSYQEFNARYKDKDAEAELKRLKARAEELIKEHQNAAKQPGAPAVEAPTRTVSAAARQTVAPAVEAPAKTVSSTAKPVASKDSKGLRIVVQGKGKTKEAAVLWAIRDAVWKTVGTWVDSKARIKENQDKVIAQVKTITEADVPKFEVIETQMRDGGFVLKVRVHVSKNKIAPKFAEIFPDVFGNVND